MDILLIIYYLLILCYSVLLSIKLEILSIQKPEEVPIEILLRFCYDLIYILKVVTPDKPQ